MLGGDHSIASADVAGIANHLGKGKVSMIHFDAHADTGEDQFGALIGHGTPMRRLIESGSVRGDRFLQLGLRGYWPDDATLKWMAGKGMKSYEMTEIHHRGMQGSTWMSHLQFLLIVVMVSFYLLISMSLIQVWHPVLARQSQVE